jgi:hypothetical protein
VFGSHEKKLQNAKIRILQMSPEFGDVRSPSPILARKFDRIRPKWPDSSRKLLDPGRFGRNPAIFRRPNVVGSGAN